MARTPLAALALLALAGVAGCASEDAPPAREPARSIAAVRHWDVRAPTLPPPDPAAYGRRATRTQQRHAAATPAAAAPAPATEPAAGPPSDEEVARELRRALGLGGGTSARSLVDTATVRRDGLATVPPGAPEVVAEIIQGANQVARKPYVYGGGHGRLASETWIDTAYDCSGSVSFALATAGLLDRPMDSSSLAAWGRPGRGRWVTIFANAGHAFMVVAGLRFDTSGRADRGTRWQEAARAVAGFTVRHPPGL